MSWLPLLLAAWIVLDVVVVAAYVAMHRHRANIRSDTNAARLTAMSARPSGRSHSLVH